jgi:truncated hemoglobin YjbI
MNEFYERVKANPKLLLVMFPHEMRSAQQEQSQQNQEG